MYAKVVIVKDMTQAFEHELASHWEGMVPPTLATDTYRLLVLVQSELAQRIEACLQQNCGISREMFEMLLALRLAGGVLRPRDLADRMLITRSGITRAIGRAEKQGYVQKKNCPQDGRGSLAHLTPQGDALVVNAWAEQKQIIAFYVGKMHDLSRMHQQLAHMLGHIRSHISSDTL